MISGWCQNDRCGAWLQFRDTVAVGVALPGVTVGPPVWPSVSVTRRIEIEVLDRAGQSDDYVCPICRKVQSL
jgi:hypothetical protein